MGTKTKLIFLPEVQRLQPPLIADPVKKIGNILDLGLELQLPEEHQLQQLELVGLII